MIRQPIICVLGHVDHGKTTLLDRIRGTAIAAREAGFITQHIGATEVPISAIERKCGPLLAKFGVKLTIPGLLFIDTPGHEAFTNLRKRGGSIADLAILVIDVSQGVQPQTVEAIGILKGFKTPFIVAATKMDLVTGWIPKKDASFAESLASQREEVQQELDNRIYSLVGELSRYGFDSDRLDRIKDFTKQIVIVPVSAKTGEGLPELLMFASGLTQRFMEKKLEIDPTKPARGTVLEVKEVTGLGKTVDAIIYDGVLRKGDTITLGGKAGPITTKVRGLLKPAALEEIRDPRKKFKSVDEVVAASGVKISAPSLDDAISGSPIIAGDPSAAMQEIEREISELKVSRDVVGVILRTDTLGALEALTGLLEGSGIPVRNADIGGVTKKDIFEAENVRNRNRLYGAVLVFNQSVPEELVAEARSRGVALLSADVIYKLMDDYKGWMEDEKKRDRDEKLQKFIYPAKVKILKGFVFRASNPAVVGVEVLGGIIKPKYPLMLENGTVVGRIQSIQEKNQTLDRAEKGRKVAVSIDGPTVGRQISEEDILFTSVPLEQLEQFEKDFEDKALLSEIRKIKEKSR